MQADAGLIACELKRAFDREDIFTRNELTADAFQREILTARERFYLINCGRQVGKSSAVAALCGHTALTQPDSNIICAAPSERQVKELLRTIKGLIRGAGYQHEIATESQLLIECKNQSRIMGVPAGAPQNVRGFSNITLAVVDEGAHLPDDELYVVLAPMLATNPRSKMFVLSTPQGMQNWFARQWHGENHWKKIEVPATDCPRIPPEFLEQQRRELGEAIFQQEYLCSFLSNETKLIEPAFLDGKTQSFGIF